MVLDPRAEEELRWFLTRGIAGIWVILTRGIAGIWVILARAEGGIKVVLDPRGRRN